VLNQTYGNLELIVVGDCCTDETEEALAEIDDPRLTFVNLPQRGPYPADPVLRWRVIGTPAWNKGLALARGDFITHLDDDDEYTLDRLEKLVKFASEEGCDLVWHPYWWETETGEWRLQEAHKFLPEQVNNVSVFYRSWFRKIPYNFDAHLLMEVSDWNRLRRIKYINPVCRRYPEPLFKYYNSRSQSIDYKRPG
jgi:glycosyltransferase involved in cell wall biosynthesis